MSRPPSRPSARAMARVRADYMSGMSISDLMKKHRFLTSRQVRQCLEGILRPKSRPSRPDPDEAEIARLRDEINRSWTPEQASLRWMGRYVTRPETLGSCLSRAIRDLGGDA